MKAIVIVLVNYKKEQELVSFVQSFIATQHYQSLHLILVDNGSIAPEVLQKFAVGKQIDLLVPGQNLGYVGAAHLALNHYLAIHQNNFPDHFIISNFDLSFDPNHFFDKMIECIDTSKVAVAGPDIISSLNGAALNPMYSKRLSNIHLNRLIHVTSHYGMFYLYQLLHYAKRKLSVKAARSQSSVENAYAVHGSMMILSKSFFEGGGSLHFESFLYGEEIFIAEQCRKLGLSSKVFHELKVIHHEHSTTGNIKNRMHMKFLNASLKYIKSKFYND